MKDKIDLALKLKQRVLAKNISLYSLKGLPPEIYNNLQSYLQNALIIYKGNLVQSKIEALSDNTFAIYHTNNLHLKPRELILVIIPFGSVRYVFLCQVINIGDNFYEVTIIEPRSEERIPLKKKIPAFLSLIPEDFIREILNTNRFFLLRESNISLDNYKTLNEFHIYDLVLDSNNMISEKFKKYIQKTLYFGELRDLSRGGCGIKCQGKIHFEDDFGIFYVKFNLILERTIKFALFCHLRNISYHDGFSVFHLAYLTELKPELWGLIKEDLLR